MSEKWKRSIRSKRGSYILEASIIAPVFLIGCLLLIWLIPVVRISEGAVFSTADEMRFQMLETGIRGKGTAFPFRTRLRIRKEAQKQVSVRTISYRSLYSSHGIRDLISIRQRVTFNKNTPLVHARPVRFQFQVTGRAFTGAERDDQAGGDGLFGEDNGMVCVFPDEGVRYHDPSCTYVRAQARLSYLNEGLKKKYHACPLCSAKGMASGSPVYVFENGSAYHSADCRSVDRYYVTVSKHSAEKKSYTPCSKCGGIH